MPYKTIFSKREKEEVWEEGQKPKVSFHSKLSSIEARCRYAKGEFYYMYGGKGVKCFLTIDDLIFLWRRDKAWELKAPTIDRKDSDGNYTLENCQYIENYENMLKAVRKQMKKVSQYSPDGKFIKTYESQGAACRALGKYTNWRSASTISSVCRGRAKKAFGFIWKYA